MFYYKPAKNGQWRWAFISVNGQMTAGNETHPTRGNAKRAAYKVAVSMAHVIGINTWICPLSEFKMKEWAERPGANKKTKLKTK